MACADLTQLRAVTHRHGGTVNDAVLAAVTGALHSLLEQRGEAVDALAVTVPVAGRPLASAGQLGTSWVRCWPSCPPPVPQPSGWAILRACKTTATSSPAIAVIAPLFRVVAWLRLYHWFINYQRLWHTLVSNLRGPTGRSASPGLGSPRRAWAKCGLV